MGCKEWDWALIARVAGALLSAGVVVSGAVQLFTDASSVKEVVNGLYQLLLGLLLLVVEARRLGWLGMMTFLRTHTGLGAAQVFVAGLVLGSAFWQVALACGLAAVGVINMFGGVAAKWVMDGEKKPAAEMPASAFDDDAPPAVPPPPRPKPPPPATTAAAASAPRDRELSADWPNE